MAKVAGRLAAVLVLLYTDQQSQKVVVQYTFAMHFILQQVGVSARLCVMS